MNRALNSLLGSLVLLFSVAAAGCGDKITNIIYVIAADGSADAEPVGGPGPIAEGGASETATTTTPDGAPPAAGDTAAPPPPPPPTDGGTPPAAYTGKPWNGTPQSIPGTLQFEFYDQGGEGVAYHDMEPLNLGSGQQNMGINTPEAMFRRGEGVDISFTKTNADRYPTGMALPANQLYVGWTLPGEWLKYTINVTETGRYMLSMHTSANNEGSTVSFTFEDGTTTGPLPIARTGSWNIWQHVDNMAIVNLAAGMHVLTVRLEAQGNNNLDYLIFTRKP